MVQRSSGATRKAELSGAIPQTLTDSMETLPQMPQLEAAKKLRRVRSRSSPASPRSRT
jgi:hypothetical protein